ncbi:MAG TPA: hypothetical protein VF752_12360 [Thermoleophilaceae bacterium]
MPNDIASLLLRKSIGALSKSRGSCCSRCRRTPVAGELMHVFESGSTLCTLCTAELPEAERRPLRSERVHMTDRHVFAVPRAA